jgi:hypothetical protein
MRSWAGDLVEKCEVVIPLCKKVQHINANTQFCAVPNTAILTSVVVSGRYELPSIGGASVMYRGGGRLLKFRFAGLSIRKLSVRSRPRSCHDNRSSSMAA